MRRLSAIHYRPYSVPGPRSLYHIDGNHKLIRSNGVFGIIVCIIVVLSQMEVCYTWLH